MDRRHQVAWVMLGLVAGSTVARAEAPAAAPSIMELAEADVVRSAVAGHPDLVVAQTNRRSADAEIVRQRARLWIPSFTLDSFWRQGATPTVNYILAASGTIQESSFDLLASIAGRTNIGTRYELRFDNRRDSTSAYADLFPTSPTYRSTLALSVVQPLLRGATRKENEADLRVALRNAEAATAETRRVAEDVVDQVVERYLAWAAKATEIEVRQEAVRLAQAQRDATERKIKAGALSALELAQAEATVAARRSELALAEREAADGETQLLRVAYLQSSSAFDWNTRFVPKGELSEPSEDVDMKSNIDLALQNRPEVKRQRALLCAQEAVVANKRAARLWRLDGRFEVGAVGLAGSLNPSGPAPIDTQNGSSAMLSGASVLPGTPPLVPNSALIGGPATAIASPWQRGTFYYLVGLTLEIPLSNQERNAELTQSEAELRRRAAELDRQVSEISLAVRGAVLQFRVDHDRLALTRESVRLAARNLEAEQRKFAAGLATTFDVLRVQAEWALARINAVQALVQASRSAVQLERERGTLLERYGIAVGDAPRKENR
jgi:HAE1 family hydrophobic/amphiphilic exporter-1